MYLKHMSEADIYCLLASIIIISSSSSSSSSTLGYKVIRVV